MSSHHFVKEGQEPALLVIDAISLPLIEPLLEWSPLIMIYEKDIDKMLTWGIKIDVVLTGESQIERVKDLLQEQAPVQVLTYQANEDPLNISLDFLTSMKQDGLSIVIENPQTLLDKLLPFLSQFHITLLSPRVKWVGIADSYKKWLEKGSKLLLHPASQPIRNEGLQPERQHYVTLSDGLIELVAATPFWVGEPL